MRSGVALVLALFVSLAGCESSLALTVDVRTDFAPGTEFFVVRTEVATTDFDSPTVAATTIRHDVVLARDYLAGVRVAELHGLPPGAYWVRTALLTRSDEIVVQRITSVDLTATFSLTAVLARSCGTTHCPPAGGPTLTACNGGVCVDPRCSPTAPAFCGTAACERDADCDAMTGACLRAVCDAGTCLYAGDDALCTHGEHCTSALTCASDAMPHCGSIGETCCQSACAAGATCDPSRVCVACGHSGQACCGTACNAGHTCTNGTCAPCGATGQPCCDGACDASHVCSGGTCTACGGREQTCCDAMACRNTALCTTTSSGPRCQCGGRSQVCCDHTTCDPGILCQSTMYGPLCLCGTEDRPCCPGRVCDDGSTCLDSIYGPLCLCGERDRPCCAGRSCTDGSTCLDSNYGPLCLCGTMNRPCCAGRACDGGFSCHDTIYGPICQ